MNYYTAERRWKDQILGDCYTCTKINTHYNNHASVVYRLVAVFCVAQQSIRIIFASLLYNSQIPTYCNNNNKKNHTLIIILTPFQG